MLVLAGRAVSALAAGPYAFTVSPSATIYLAAGGNLTLSVNLSYGSSISALDFSLTTPTGWKYISNSGTAVPQTPPQAGDLGQGGLAFVYSAMPASPATFSFTVSYPAAMSGNKSLTLIAAHFTDEATSGVTSVAVGNIVLTPALSALTASQAVASTTLTATTIAAGFTPVVAANGTPPYKYAVSPALPAGLTLSAATGAIGGTPAVASIVTTYTITVTDATNATASGTFGLAVNPALPTTAVVGGAAGIAGADIAHPNGNIYDQVLLTGNSATIANGPNKITRTSYIDLNDDIVQVEFAGAGTLALTLDNSSGPTAPLNYNQPNVAYMKGHATIAITGADKTSNLTVFSVGRTTAFDSTGAYNFVQPISATNNPANNGSPLFQGHGATAYDGIADLALISIASTDGKFGGIRAANAACFGDTGLTGINAPGVAFQGPVFIGDIAASGTAMPVFIIGSATDTRITGGDLLQTNTRPIVVAGLAQLKFTDGLTSNNVRLPAQLNKGVLQQNGVDVTGQVVVNPGP